MELKEYKISAAQFKQLKTIAVTMDSHFMSTALKLLINDIQDKNEDQHAKDNDKH